jgi:hypothetical protein
VFGVEVKGELEIGVVDELTGGVMIEDIIDEFEGVRVDVTREVSEGVKIDEIEGEINGNVD